MKQIKLSNPQRRVVRAIHYAGIDGTLVTNRAIRALTNMSKDTTHGVLTELRNMNMLKPGIAYRLHDSVIIDRYSMIWRRTPREVANG